MRGRETRWTWRPVIQPRLQLFGHEFDDEHDKYEQNTPHRRFPSPFSVAVFRRRRRRRRRRRCRCRSPLPFPLPLPFVVAVAVAVPFAPLLDVSPSLAPHPQTADQARQHESYTLSQGFSRVSASFAASLRGIQAGVA